MNTRWLMFNFRCDHELSELLIDGLSALGACGVETIDKEEITELVKRPDSLDYASESFLASLPETASVRAWFAIGEEADVPYPELPVQVKENPSFFGEIYESDPLTYIPFSELETRIREMLSQFCAGMEAEGEYLGAEILKEEAWSEKWKEFYQTLHISPRIVINPTWLEYQPAPGEKMVRLDPGSAFGTGYHESTAGCIRFLDEMDAADHEGFCAKRMLDLGCGSGILAIVCSKLGVRDIEACDIDPSAVKIARENMLQNELDPDTDVRLFTGELSHCSGGYDLIIANLVAKLHLLLRDEYAAKLKPEGRVMLSGIIDERSGEVMQSFAEAGWKLCEARRSGDWWTLIYQRTALPGKAF